MYAAKRLRVFCVGQMQLLFVSCLQVHLPVGPKRLRAIRRDRSETSSEDWDKVDEDLSGQAAASASGGASNSQYMCHNIIY